MGPQDWDIVKGTKILPPNVAFCDINLKLLIKKQTNQQQQQNTQK